MFRILGVGVAAGGPHLAVPDRTATFHFQPLEDLMARTRIARLARLLAAAPLMGALLLAGAGAAQAAVGAGAANGSNGSVVIDTGSGNVFGPVNGNYNWTQQTATGSGASNQNNTLGVKGNSGLVYAVQNNLDLHFARSVG